MGASSGRDGSLRCWPCFILREVPQPSAWGLLSISAVNWKAAFNMPARERMQISSFSLFWVRFMPPPHAQPPGSNKSQRGRECCKETFTLQFLCEGQGNGMCGDQRAAPRHIAPASQTWSSTHSNFFPPLQQRPSPRAPGETETGFASYSSAFPSLLRKCCMCAQVLETGMEPSTSSRQTGLLQRSALCLLCAKVLPSMWWAGHPPAPQAWAASETYS